MSVNAAIKAAVEPIIPVCVPGVYRGSSPVFSTFNAVEIPDCFGDNSPDSIRYLVQLHYCCPDGQNPLNTKRELRRALMSAGFTAPTVTDASDGDGQHFVFECEYLDGDV